MTSGATRIAIVGGGPAGSLLAILLARRGHSPVVLERSAPFAAGAPTGGRSINLALAARGLEALRRADLERDVAKLLIPMRGRMLHDPAGQLRFLPYGQRASEEIYSVSRAALNTLLFRLAAERHGVEYRFEHRCTDVELSTGAPIVATPSGASRIEADVVFAADGAGSEVRRALAAAGKIATTEALLDHGYKELTIAAGRSGESVLERHALHIWPRGGFMLIALPNPDGSFTATLFLPNEGKTSFAALDRTTIGELFRREFADALPLIPALEREFSEHPTGLLGTVTCRPWSVNNLLMVGDAAHAIVPFHGQGMNAAFEDCIALDRLVGAHCTPESGDWPAVFEEFEHERAPNAQAIAEMAVENYREMRDEVRDPKFKLRADLSFELERRFPGKFIPRYSMVMFHPEISYAEAQRRGAAQAAILRRLTTGVASLDAVDFEAAETLVAAEL
jgi:kynurenine 3-monooxygenase